MPKKQKSTISSFFEHPRKITKIKDFLFFGMTFNDAKQMTINDSK